MGKANANIKLNRCKALQHQKMLMNIPCGAVFPYYPDQISLQHS